MPTVSVIVPCYRYGQYVTECVTSLLANREVDLDILVVDDASPDDSWSVVQRLSAVDSRIRARRNESNQGLIATANDAIAAAAGDYVVLLSADDAHAPGWLDRAVTHLQAHPRAVLAYGPTRRFSGQMPAVDRSRPVRVEVHPGHDWLAGRCAAGFPALFSPEAVVRTSAQHAVGGYDPTLPYSSDLEMWLRLASIGDVIFVGGPVAAMYRVTPTSMSRIARVNLINELRFIRDAYEAWWRFAQDRVPDRDTLLASAKAALARRAMRRAVVAFLADPSGAEVDELCGYAIECDRDWAGPRVQRLRRTRSRAAVRHLVRISRPATTAAVRGYRMADDVRHRLGAR